MSLYQYSWTSPGVLKDDGIGTQPMFIPYAIENTEFRLFARWLLAGNTCEPAEVKDFWPAQDPMPWTLTELEEQLKSYPE